MRVQATKRNFRKVLLENQTEDLSKIKRHVSDCARYARKSYDLHKDRFAIELKCLHLEKEKFNFKKQMMLEKQNHRSDQLQYQMLLLQYKKQKLAFEMERTTVDVHEDNQKSNEDDSDDE